MISLGVKLDMYSNSSNQINAGFIKFSNEEFQFIANWTDSGFFVKGKNLSLKTLLTDEDILKMFANCSCFNNYHNYVDFVLKHYIGCSSLSIDVSKITTSIKVKKFRDANISKFNDIFTQRFINPDRWDVGENPITGLNWDNINEKYSNYKLS